MPVPCSKEEIDALIEASIENDFAYTLFLTAKSTGRRLGEYYNVKVSGIDFEKQVMMTQVLKRKRKVEKEAILSDEVCLQLKRYIRMANLKLEDYLFRKVGYRQIQNLVVKYSKKAGIPHNVSFHNFRHYFITALVRQGWNYEKISKLTGHSSPGTLVHYDHAVASDIKEDALEALREL